ncbi:MAG: hypothetical protein F6K34_07205 [Okeania sp. SIO4D6]|uniref:hypothetical protein n=1 Tax=Okeania sp. SIO2F5 TaxID=2607794 RepID=UPI0013BD4BE9|nr:hypothetical protein [Okeania sp. SIO2F5]NEP04633.1 hypothetical protein [Okeania sp. SIO4D6]NEP92155.1 hypothetical protein [Okeania sp. SIO2F5]
MNSRGRRQETADRRQPTPRPSPSQEGKTGEMDRERGSRSKNCKNDFSAQLCA